MTTRRQRKIRDLGFLRDELDVLRLVAIAGSHGHDRDGASAEFQAQRVVDVADRVQGIVTEDEGEMLSDLATRPAPLDLLAACEGLMTRVCETLDDEQAKEAAGG